MTKFITKTSLFITILIAILLIGILLPDMSPVQSLHYSIIDKQKLLQKIDSPRLILVGGSNLTFGIDSKKIQDALGLNVVNTAISAGYGLQFIFDYIKPYIRKGDIVVLSLEYGLFFGNKVWGGKPLLKVLDAVPETLSLITFRELVNQLKYIPEYSIEKYEQYILSFVKPKPFPKEIGVYERRSFNEFGDVDAHLDKPNKRISSYATKGNKVNLFAINLIDNFKIYIESKKGVLLITYPCINSSSYKLSRKQIKLVEQELIKRKYLLLGSPERYSFPDEYYFNTHYHLNKNGVDIRTKFLIQDLKKYLK